MKWKRLSNVDQPGYINIFSEWVNGLERENERIGHEGSHGGDLFLLPLIMTSSLISGVQKLLTTSCHSGDNVKEI